MKIQNIKGTQDIFGNTAIQYQKIENLLITLAEKYGYSEFRTPILEYKKLFVRENDSSDIVQKQMYCLYDMGKRELALRPEGTPGVMRCVINSNLYKNISRIKAYYLGNFFRYERPKKFSYRQFTQFGIENIGNDNVYCDIETILLGFNILKQLGFKKIVLKINSLGDLESQKKYKNKLKNFFASHINCMCADCKKRFLQNPMRILDCKNEEDKKIIKNAPKITDSLNNNSLLKFQKILDLLKKLKITYVIDYFLVRGLDYYTHIVYEFFVNNEETAVGGGGHYDYLAQEIGEIELTGTGFSFGIERILMSLQKENLILCAKEINIEIIPINTNNFEKCFSVAEKIRKNTNFKTDIIFEKQKIKTLLSKAQKNETDFIIIIGDKEEKNKNITVKNMKTKEEITVSDNEIEKFFDSLYKNMDQK
ncbi:MAG: histidine--tRNA ligase [Bacilli bacterium]|nr:histidine--tRNA ligase [Bacilli bacterium]